MTTWRERVLIDRAAGGVSQESMQAWMGVETCPVGEGVTRLGLHWEEEEEEFCNMWDRVNGGFITDRGGFSSRFMQAMTSSDWGTAEDVLDGIEDRVLAIKREAGS